jgi:hypothetical protein
MPDWPSTKDRLSGSQHANGAATVRQETRRAIADPMAQCARDGTIEGSAVSRVLPPPSVPAPRLSVPPPSVRLSASDLQEQR